MKKLAIALFAVAAMVVTAKADFAWSTWFDGPAQNADRQGCVLGLASEVNSMKGAQIDLCISKANEFKSGCQYAIGYSRVVTLRNGVQIGFWNNAQHAALQLGLICHNEGGFLPWFPFFNFDKTMFGKAK